MSFSRLHNHKIGPYITRMFKIIREYQPKIVRSTLNIKMPMCSAEIEGTNERESIWSGVFAHPDRSGVA